jgi:hypothetical protein
MIQRQPVSPAAYTDPDVLLCAYCGKKVKWESARGQAVGLMFSTQIWCSNEDCPAFEKVGDVQITALPGSKHRGHPVVAKKEAEDAV